MFASQNPDNIHLILRFIIGLNQDDWLRLMGPLNMNEYYQGFEGATQNSADSAGCIDITDVCRIFNKLGITTKKQEQTTTYNVYTS